MKTGHIEILPPEVARKIAAGEVIDRPAALAREFIDNAIDAGAKNITLEIAEGGAKMLSVIDDGEGMSREDLALCWQTHATSKIRSVEDLSHAETLGFRGEALSAAAAVSRLEIITSRDGREAFRLDLSPGGRDAEISPAHHAKGSTVRTGGLFDNIPARKRFLKRDGAEANLCKQALIDKALGFPGINFRFIQDGKLKLFLPAAASLGERFGAALLEEREAQFLHEIQASGEGFMVTIVAGGPELFRRDRRQQYVIANGRRIQDYALIQALEYGVQGWFPNGTHPVGAVYIEIDPVLADFNIHPAKREARFRDAGAVHHAITGALQKFMRHRGSAEQKRLREEHAPALHFDSGPQGYAPKPYSRERGYSPGPDDPGMKTAMEALLDKRPSFSPLPRKTENNGGAAADATPSYNRSVKYRGRAFDLFILAEKDGTLYIIDQHAAHERILFDRFLKSPIRSQELLVAIPFETDSDEDNAFLEKHIDDFAALGLRMKKEGAYSWHIEALPVNWKLDDRKTVEEILNLRSAREDISRRWAATLACHAAVRDGDYLDEDAALALAEEALALPDPHCPHGRPVWSEISLDSLLRAVKRL